MVQYYENGHCAFVHVEEFLLFLSMIKNTDGKIKGEYSIGNKTLDIPKLLKVLKFE